MGRRICPIIGAFRSPLRSVRRLQMHHVSVRPTRPVGSASPGRLPLCSPFIPAPVPTSCLAERRTPTADRLTLSAFLVSTLAKTPRTGTPALPRRGNDKAATSRRTPKGHGVDEPAARPSQRQGADATHSAGSVQAPRGPPPLRFGCGYAAPWKSMVARPVPAR